MTSHDAGIKKHGVLSGAGLVIANMIGIGVLISTGFMAQDLSPSSILLSWVLGSVIAATGVLAYSGIATAINKSGGEYRFLADLCHPFLGYLSGWGSLILGFSAAIAVEAYTIGSFVNTLIAGPDPRITGLFIVLLIAAFHSFNLNWSHRGQNILVITKVGFLVAFIFLCLLFTGSYTADWSPANYHEKFPVDIFLENQFWIVFAFSGWNAAVYTASEFKKPQRDVGRAMLLGLAFVSLIYFLLNWIFVVNLTPEKAAVVFHYEEARITLAHIIASDLFGGIGGKIVSIFIILAFASGISSMFMVGPRVYQAMATDGYLPEVFRSSNDKPPTYATLLQCMVCIVLLFSHTLRETVLAASAFLMIFSVLTALSIFRISKVFPSAPKPKTYQLIAACIFSTATLCILYFGVSVSSKQWYTLASVLFLALIGFLLARKQVSQLKAE